MTGPWPPRALVASIAIPAAAVFLGLAQATPPPADLVLTGGRIWTADPAKPWAEAVAIRDGRIVYVGDAAGADASSRARARAWPASGAASSLPGFNDAHIHLMSGALSLERVDLIEDGRRGRPCRQRIRAFAAANPTVALGARPRLAVRLVPRRPAHEGAARRRGVRPARLHGVLRRPQRAGPTPRPWPWPASRGTRRTRPTARSSAMPRGEPTGALKESATALVDSQDPAARRRAALRPAAAGPAPARTARASRRSRTRATRRGSSPATRRPAGAARSARASCSVRITASVQMGQDDVRPRGGRGAAPRRAAPRRAACASGRSRGTSTA